MFVYLYSHREVAMERIQSNDSLDSSPGYESGLKIIIPGLTQIQINGISTFD